MITELSIRNFQSLAKADLTLGQFTAIVGPSSSGKSALIRACRALASNVRGTSMITRGQKQMAVSARTEKHIITLERSERSSAYRLTADGQERVFTKLDGGVPEPVSDALRLDPDAASVNFAAQFDKPYLLDESGATVARELAELTQVNLIFEAVRSANRICANAKAQVKTRKSDLARINLRLAQFQGLPDRLDKVDTLERLNNERKDLHNRITFLGSAARALHIAETSQAKARPKPVPDDTPLHAAVARVKALQKALSALQNAENVRDVISAELPDARARVEHCEQQMAEALRRAGVCPTCGQSTHGVRSDPGE